MGKYKLRDCSELIERLNDEKYDKERLLLNKIVKRKDLFVGIRHKSIMVYSYGAKILDITYDKSDRFLFNTNPKYVGGIALPMDVEVCDAELNNIINAARKTYSNQGNSETKSQQEKICQQWIVDANNNNPLSPYYYVDMEYNTQGTRLGRFDIVAISKEAKGDSGKHALYLIELKVGAKSYAGSWKKDESHNAFYSDEKAIFTDGENNQYKHPLKFGSGIVGHITDYIRFLKNDIFYTQLKENVCSIIQCKKRLGCLDSNWEICNATVEDIDEKPQIIILTYTNVPKEALYGGNLPGNEKVDIETLITQMKKYLFSGTGNSEYNLKDAINNNVIRGFVELSDKKIEEVTYVPQMIDGREYTFVLKFIDGDAEDSWECI